MMCRAQTMTAAYGRCKAGCGRGSQVRRSRKKPGGGWASGLAPPMFSEKSGSVDDAAHAAVDAHARRGRTRRGDGFLAVGLVGLDLDDLDDLLAGAEAAEQRALVAVARRALRTAGQLALGRLPQGLA